MENIPNLSANPFLIDLILESLFSSCSWDELKNCRLVCKQWNTLSIPFWIEAGPCIPLYDTTTKQRNVQKFVCSSSKSECLPTTVAVGLHQYKKFHLVIRTTPLSQFTMKIGDRISKLELEYTFRLRKTDEFRDLMFCKYTPVLKELKLKLWSLDDARYHRRYNSTKIGKIYTEMRNVKIYDLSDKYEARDVETIPTLECLDISFGNGEEDEPPRFPIGWTELLDHYPNLRTLRLGQCLGKEVKLLTRVFGAIKKIRKANPEKLQLKNIDILGVTSAAGLSSDEKFFEFLSTLPNFLRSSRLRLEALSLHLQDFHSDLHVMEVFEYVANSLKRLTLHVLDCYQGSLNEFPRMQLLQSLELCGYFKSYDFLGNAGPNLKSVNLRASNGTSWYDGLKKQDAKYSESIMSITPSLDNLVLSSMSKFSCDYYTDYGPHDITRLHKMCPNLSHLGLVLSNNSFRLVCQTFRELRHLVVFGLDGEVLSQNKIQNVDSLDDAGITGMSCWESECPADLERQPNLTDLKYLKTLDFQRRDLLLTQNSLLFGFLLMSRLEEISFFANTVNPTQIEDTVLTDLRERIRVVNVKFIKSA